MKNTDCHKCRQLQGEDGRCVDCYEEYIENKEKIQEFENSKEEILEKSRKFVSMGELIVSYLKENKFDGLVNNYAECGCSLDDLWPCTGFDGCGIPECKPAFKIEKHCPSWDEDWGFSTDKNPDICWCGEKHDNEGEEA